MKFSVFRTSYSSDFSLATFLSAPDVKLLLVLGEVLDLVQNGTQETTLLGQNVSGYHGNIIKEIKEDTAKITNANLSNALAAAKDFISDLQKNCDYAKLSLGVGAIRYQKRKQLAPVNRRSFFLQS